MGLLVDAEVIRALEALPDRVRRQLWLRMEAIGATPHRFADYPERTPQGRDVDVHLCGQFAIVFWDDFADRDVKILALRSADR
jgi:hypothetical protein